MAAPKVTAKCCKICNNVLASNVKVCIHCGVCDPIKKPDAPFWPWILAFVIVLIFLLGDQWHR